MLTIVLASSLLDEEHVGRSTGRSKRRNTGCESGVPSLGGGLPCLPCPSVTARGDGLAAAAGMRLASICCGTELLCHATAWSPSLGSFLSMLLELSTYSLLLYWSIQYFSLEINWEKRLLESKVGALRQGLRGPGVPAVKEALP